MSGAFVFSLLAAVLFFLLAFLTWIISEEVDSVILEIMAIGFLVCGLIFLVFFTILSIVLMVLCLVGGETCWKYTTSTLSERKF